MVNKSHRLPVLVTVIAVVTFFIGVIGILLSFAIFYRWQEFLIGLLGAVAGIGLLRMKQWAIWGYLFSLIVAILSTCMYVMNNSIGNSFFIATLTVSVAVLLLRIYFAYYLFRHKSLFSKGV